ncbi:MULTISPECIES: hypothetical protein [unclassified Variovorax]|nr:MULTISPECIES: hypothetical protein [unclassified Variovorax]KWT96831.1 hypothetical protein APY03_2037 [Variovorax sp. WDL1]
MFFLKGPDSAVQRRNIGGGARKSQIAVIEGAAMQALDDASGFSC